MVKIILTGVSQGLGKELFDILSKKNINLTAISRRFLAYQSKLAKNKPNIELLKVDLSNFNNEINTEKEDIIFINNAACVNPIDKIENIDEKHIAYAVNLNFLTPMIIIKKLAKHKLFVINISTGAAIHPIDNWSLYCSTKAGFEMFLKVIEKEENIEIVSIDPGVMDTKMQKIIRNSNFKDVNNFVKYKEDNILKNPKDVAQEIYKKHIKERI